MKYGLLMPHGGPDLNTPQKITEYAILAEDSDWDGFFIWDSIAFAAVDPWICLAHIASMTEAIKFGAMVTPMARRRPWMLAKALVSLDQLSNGRVIFGAGLGDDIVFDAIGEPVDKKVRARMLDESLEILDRLLRGENFSFEGEFYTLKNVACETGVQKPRIPFWMGGLWPAKGPFRRAARWDGMMPHTIRSSSGDARLELDEIEDIMEYIASYRAESMDDFTMSMLSYLPKDKNEAVKLVEQYHLRGVKWWVESVHEWKTESVNEIRERIIAGPPDY